jgi:hypothetical protein
VNPEKRVDLAEAGTDQITLRHSRGNLSTGKHNPGSWRNGRQRNRRSYQKGCDKQAALIQPNHDPRGIITWVGRQKHAENGKQQQEDDPDLKNLLHKNMIAPYWEQGSPVIFPTAAENKRPYKDRALRAAWVSCTPEPQILFTPAPRSTPGR